MTAKTAKQPDAIALLKADHRKVEGLFEKFEKAKDGRTKLSLAKEICTELTVHTIIEEEIFYPACKDVVEEDLNAEAYVEHDGAKVLIAELEGSGPDNEFYAAKMKVLSEQIKHHVKEEEKPSEGFFAQARDGGIDMDALGEQLAARKQELLAQIKKGRIAATGNAQFHGSQNGTGRTRGNAWVNRLQPHLDERQMNGVLQVRSGGCARILATSESALRCNCRRWSKGERK